ncbi:hypothetical protein QBC37DRAFT_413816 [Rhypophila decipiens]|uniref:18S rRNA factor 2 n=1 Tax=Rhypophila decipiens TaxID=261697 RepID=A0AAN6YHF5_9PEZI|nr:hypothetical protein QBC37DRAFT_413816 [Rhypophila decipiens]
MQVCSFRNQDLIPHLQIAPTPNSQETRPVIYKSCDCWFPENSNYHTDKMSANRRRNQFLDAGDSDDDSIGAEYGSDDEGFVKGTGKRRKLEISDSEASDLEDDYNNKNAEGNSVANLQEQPLQEGKRRELETPDSDASDLEDDNDAKGNSVANPQEQRPQDDESKSDTTTTKKPKKTSSSSKEISLPSQVKPITKKNLVSTQSAIKKSGVVYLSRIPPFMKPAKVRSLLEPYGKINRMFLAPEDPTAHARRVRAGGNKKKSYTEGWVEFVNKKDAKKVCELLNATTIGGKKGGYYRDDIWNLLYLKGFKWHNLTEQIAAETAERQSRLRAEISKSTKENQEFVRNLERAKVQDGRAAKNEIKKKRKQGLDEAGETETAAGGEDAAEGGKNRRSTFKQVPLAKKRKVDDGEMPELKRVSSKVLG